MDVTTDEDVLIERRSKSRKSSVSSCKLSTTDTFPAAIGSKKKTILLDAFGQPRKSPREHASTLAILSTIVQQRRKRFKEMNGGISPEKMGDNYMHANGLSDLTDDDDCDSCDPFDQNSHGSDSNSKLDGKPLTDKGSDVAHSSEAEGDSAINEPTGHKFLLRKGLRRSGLTSPSVDRQKRSSTSRKATPIPVDGEGDGDGDDDDNNSQKEIKYPKIPVDDYVDPNIVAQQLDAVLNECFAEVNDDLENFSMSFDDNSEPSDLVLLNTPKDFVEIVSTVKEGPLTYRYTNSNNSGLSCFMKGKKRRNNKTGWPSVPKRRTMIKREKRNGSAVEDAGTQSNTEDEDATLLPTEPLETIELSSDRVDISSQLMKSDADEYFIQSRQRSPRPKIKQESDSMDEDDAVNAIGGDKDDYEDYEEDDDICIEPYLNANDNAINNVFTSSSEKAENSDIFTVSSDSRDTADTGVDRTKPPVVNNASGKEEEDDDDESINDTDDDSLSEANMPAPDTIDKQQKSVTAPRKMETRGKGDRTSSILAKHADRLNALQPVVCVRKICEKDLYRRTYGRSTSKSPQKTKESPSKQITLNNSVHSRTSCSPRGKTSPRKLRKPRGRYYKER